MLIGLAAAGAQAGHLGVYQLRFGSAAQQLQSTGAHTYFPILAKTSLGAVAMVLIGALLLVGVVRVLSESRLMRRHAGPSFLRLLAALFTIQLGLFTAQEVTEAVIAGLPAQSAAQLLLWGIVGQLPIAVLAATALRWLWSRVASSAEELASVARVGIVPPAITPLPAIGVIDSDRALMLAHLARSAFPRRGPPDSSSTRTF